MGAPLERLKDYRFSGVVKLRAHVSTKIAFPSADPELELAGKGTIAS